MNPNIESILKNIDAAELNVIAKAATGNPSASLSGTPNWQEIDAVHNDQRTVAIVRCSGAAEAGGKKLDWSSVVKIVDASVRDRGAGGWNDPDVEEKIYEFGLMKDTGSPLRPARCFDISQTHGGVKLFWLEDLGNAPQPPWSHDEYLSTARHIGEFNGRVALAPPQLPFDLPVDVHRLRKETEARRFGDNIASFAEHSSHPLIRVALQDVPVESVLELYSLWGELHKITPGLPHAMAFGDCHARNLFPLVDETVAIDWAGLAFDPVGADLSVLVGSGFSWGLDEGTMLGQSEPAIFEAYMEGLNESGWTGDRRDVRRAFFTHLPLYLLIAAFGVDGIRSGRASQRKDWVEARRGASFAEIPQRMAPIIALIPGYVSELRELVK